MLLRIGRRTLAPCLGALLLGLTAAPLARAEAPNWDELLDAFKDTWRIDGEEDPGLRSKLRAKKRAAAKGMRGSQDGRAVGILLGAHKKQAKFVDTLRKQWSKRLAAWEKAAPVMRKALMAKQKRAGPDGKISVTPAEKDWIDEQERLQNLNREISNEEEIADYIRKAAARVVDTLEEGAEKERALGDLLKAAGDGQSPAELEFVRVLGYIGGAGARRALEGFAGSVAPFVVQAALEALGRQNDPGSIDTLMGRLEDPRWQVRVAALQGLAFYREARVVEALLERMKQEDGVMQRHYFTTLCQIFGESVPATVEAFVSWWANNKESVLARWAAGDRTGPVVDDPPAIMVSGGHGGSTSFYGLRTDSKHIIFVIDVSGSMGEQGGQNAQGQFRIDVAKRELVNAIRSLSAQERDERGESSFNVVAYAADVRVHKSGKMIAASKVNKDRAFRWIEKLEANGATNIHDALVQAFEIIGTRKVSKQYEKGADTILLMTDGKPTAGEVMDPVLIREAIKKLNRDRKLTIHTIGVGEGHDANFLRRLAAENHGEYVAHN